MLRSSWALLSVGAVLVAGYVAASFAGAPVPVTGALYLAVGLGGVAATAAGILRHRPGLPTAWWCVVAGHALWVVADGLYYRTLGQGGTVPFPSAADTLYGLGYLPLAFGLLLMARSRRREGRLAGAVDGAVVCVGLGLLTWALLVGPLLGAASTGTAARATSITYLVCDVLVAALVAQLVAVSTRITPSFWLSVAAVGLLLVADSSYVWPAVAELLGGAAAGACWLVSSLLWGAAALHPTMASPLATAPADRQLTVRRVVVLLMATLLAPATLAVQLTVGTSTSAWPVVVAMVLQASLLVARMGMALHVVQASLAAREVMRRRLEHQAGHDPLTGLANRARSRERLELALLRARDHGTAVGLLFIDLDGFKPVNDTYGHRAGDELLVEVAARIAGSVRAGDSVGRLGGDEFVVVLEDFTDDDEVRQVALRVAAAVREPVVADGCVVSVGTSIGAAVSPAGLTDPTSLLHEADTAVYRAKELGRGRVVVYDEAMRREVEHRAEMADDLRTAVTQGQLELHYQAMVTLPAALVCGVEAVVRWNHPVRGLLLQGEFLEVAESSDVGVEIGRWMVGEASRQLVAWAREAPPGARPLVGVNLSPRHLARGDVVDDVLGALATAGADPARFVVEVAEGVVVRSAAVAGNLRRLRDHGVGVGIDDFGTGGTPLARLRGLPADRLKVDRSLVAADGPGTERLLALAVRAGHAAGVTVLAEGVETPEDLARALDAGADLGQGRLWGLAVPADQVRWAAVPLPA